MVQPNQINVAFGRAVAKRRQELRLTQSMLSGLTGLSRASIASIEKGRQNILLHHVYDLAQALQLRHAGDLLPARPGSQKGEFEVRVSHGDVSDQEAADVSALIGRFLRNDEDVEISS